MHFVRRRPTKQNVGHVPACTNAGYLFRIDHNFSSRAESDRRSDK